MFWIEINYNTLKKFFIYLFIISNLIFFSCAEKNTSLDAKIENQILLYRKKNDYKLGICVALYSLNVGLEYNFANGYFSFDSREQMMPDMPHILYSITKSFTASCVVKLINEGKLSYDDKVSDYLVGINEIYINKDATIKELLSHRSGIFDYTENSALFYNNPFANNNEWNPARILDYIEIPSADRNIESGKYSFMYSSANYILLGMIVEKITGKTLSEYINENFLSSLNLSFLLAPDEKTNFSYIAHPHVYPNTAPLHLVGDGKNPIDVTNVISNVIELSAKCGWAAGGMVSTASEVARWGYELLSEDGKINNNIRESIINSVSYYKDMSRLSEAYGYGVRKLFHNGYELIGSYGRSIGDENLMFYNKDKDICICILTNSNTKLDGSPNIDELMYAIFDIL